MVKWVLLFRKEEEQYVYLYAPMDLTEIRGRLRKGWRVISE